MTAGRAERGVAWTVVVGGVPTSAWRSEVEAWAPRLVVPTESPEAIPDLAREAVVWLPPRAIVDASVRAAIEGFCAQQPGGVGTAIWEAEHGSGVVPLGEHVVVASPGAARFGAEGPVPGPGAKRTSLPCRLRLKVPDRVSEYMGAVNEESTAAALVWGRSGGARPRWWVQSVRPLVSLLSSFLRSTGPRRRAFTVAFLESFVASAALAKRWELEFPEEEPPA